MNRFERRSLVNDVCLLQTYSVVARTHTGLHALLTTKIIPASSSSFSSSSSLVSPLYNYCNFHDFFTVILLIILTIITSITFIAFVSSHIVSSSEMCHSQLLFPLISVCCKGFNFGMVYWTHLSVAYNVTPRNRSPYQMPG